MEELKIIMQTLATLGQTAKEGFIWWVVIDRLVPVLMKGGAIGGVLWIIYYAIRSWISYLMADRRIAREEKDALKTIQVIRGILGIYKFPGAQQDGQWYDEKDFKDTVEAVRAVKVAAAKKDADK